MNAAAMKQTRFVLPIADEVRLVDLTTARAVLGITAEEVTERLEDHKRDDYLQAFDLSTTTDREEDDGRRRELRIWAGALRGSGITDPQTIIADCLLTNLVGLENETFHLNSSQLERAWCVSNQTIIELIRKKLITGAKVGRNWKVKRSSAAAFLKGRML
ncbi:MAG TPA: helix-turn-helix domain-containing protein [Verrucomicrobiae bacterium]|nr:helix-turn-helix domain-containing protein [Verrucomicrobiae bacterium]